VTYFLTATLDDAAGASVASVVTVTPPPGILDPSWDDNSAVDVNGIGVAPSLSVSDLTVALRSGGPMTASLTVALAAALPYDLTLRFATADETAVAGTDYTTAAGVLTFPAGETSRAVEVEVQPGSEAAADRRFFVDFEVTSPSGADPRRAAVTLAWPSGFYTVAPCRLVDTRADAEGGPALEAGRVRRFASAGHCGIPSTAKALAANVTVTDASAAGDLRVSAAGLAMPETSVLSYGADQTRAALAVVALGAEGEVEVWPGQSSGTAHLLVDVTGFFK
jgi:hypothetical protein